ncbi:MAG: hypothetical protein K2V38_01995 [Gemmataceae bacterium]|nr:hypothetical protein [Gemmataceae bacterium]
MKNVFGFPARFVFAGGALAAALLAVVGCGSSPGDLAGKVTYKDKNLRQGTVNVIAADGSAHSGTIQDDGNYSIKGIPQGAAKVSVSSPDPKTIVVAQRKGKDAPKSEVVLPDASKWFAIPDQYNDPKTSNLTTTIKGGENNKYDIELK